MKLFTNEASNPTVNAQRNLMGRTHFVDPDTLRYHKSRVISARQTDNGLLFAIVTSDSLNWEGTKRGFRFAVFDVFGTCLERPELEQAYRTSAQAEKAMWAFLNGFDAVSHTRKAIVRAETSFAQEIEMFRDKVNAIADKIAHAKAE